MLRTTHGVYRLWLGIPEHRSLLTAVFISVIFHVLLLNLSGSISGQRDIYQSGPPVLEISLNSQKMDEAPSQLNPQSESHQQTETQLPPTDALARVAEQQSPVQHVTPEKNRKSDEKAGKVAAIPVFIFDIKPEYPLHQFVLGTVGSVTATFQITEVGGIDNVKIVDSRPIGVFDNAVLEAIQSAKFREGTPKTKGWFAVTIVFDPAGTKVEPPKLQLP